MRINRDKRRMAGISSSGQFAKALNFQLLRLDQKRAHAQLKLWEELLVALTDLLSFTTNKDSSSESSEEKRVSCMRMLRLLVAPNPRSVESNRQKALAIIGVHICPRCKTGVEESTGKKVTCADIRGLLELSINPFRK
jgi:hypothetical protein